MTTATDCEVRPVAGRAFEDILDGYFPLSEAVRQMMARHSFVSMWITLLHAPVMNIRGLPPTAPVPLSVPKTYSGMIEYMALSAAPSDDGVRLAGAGEWFWVDGREEMQTFPTSTRLGEPAFVRGIGIGGASNENSPATVGLACIDPAMPVDAGLAEATGRLGWRASRAWGFGQAVSSIQRARCLEAPRALFGSMFDAPDGAADNPPLPAAPLPRDWDYLLIDVSPDQPDQEVLGLARRL